MKKGSKLKLALIPDETTRKQTFKKRKSGFLKKIKELVTLCDVKACAVVYSPYESNLEAWPSKEGVEEVVSSFLALSKTEQVKKMFNQEAFLCERITKGKKQVRKLHDENRESHLKGFMFDCLKGNMIGYNNDARDIQDLRSFIDYYIRKLAHRIDILMENGESSSFLPPPPSPLHLAPILNAALPTVADAAHADVPIMFNDQIQYNMDIQHEHPAQYQDVVGFYDQPHHRLHDMNMEVNENSNQDLNFNQNLDVTLNSNQYPSHQLSFTNLLMGIHGQMDYAGEQGNIPFTVGSNIPDYRFSAANLASHADVYYPNITNDLATNSHIPSITTANANDFSPYITNGLSTNSHMAYVTTANANGFPACITNGLSTTPDMPSITTANDNGLVPYINNNVSTMVSDCASITTTNANDFPSYITNDLCTTSHMPSISTTNANVFGQ